MVGPIRALNNIMNFKNFYAFILILISLFLTKSIVGQSTIKGQIFNINSLEPVANASILIIDSNDRTTSDQNGKFIIKAKYEFPLTLFFSCIGFVNKEVELLILPDNDLNIFMQDLDLVDPNEVVPPRNPNKSNGGQGYDMEDDDGKSDDNYDTPSAPYEDSAMKNFLNAKFPFPPPECHTAYEMPGRVFKNCENLGDVEQKISDALDTENYPYRFLSVPNGFAVVTQMEQYNEDGSIIKDSGTRWVHYPKQEAFSWSINYFNSLIFPRKGYLRIFVYIITSEVYSSTKEVVSKDQAASWHKRGVNKLPSQVANIPLSEDYTINLLLYEFEVPESNHVAEQNCPCKFPAKEHLKHSGLKAHFF